MQVPDFMLQQTTPEANGPTNDEMGEIVALAQQQLYLQEEVATIEAHLAIAREDLRKIEEVALPDAMAAVGMSKFSLADGTAITIKEDVYASIRVDFTREAADWLDSIRCGGVVKDEVKCNLARGEMAKAKQLLDLAKQLDVPATEKLSVHPQTLKALVKEKRAQGINFPEEYFSIADKRIAVIKAPK